MAEAPRIFLSYARSDGQDFAADLRGRLEHERFGLWQDLAHMEGGRDWWPQILKAIDHTEYLVLVMTPAALSSPDVRREWRYARQEGKCVIPVMGAKTLNFEALPRWMRRAHFVDTDEPDQWRRFVRTLEAPSKAERVPFMARNLPRRYVERLSEMATLRALLLSPDRAEPVAITTAIKGAGGYGKTTLATALCHDEAIQEAFGDGILWVTLGQDLSTSGLLDLVCDLIEVLAGERPRFAHLDAASSRLAEILRDRQVLIVVDDVWSRAQLQAFLEGGPRCARVITTRNSDVVPAGAKCVQVDAMQTGEAVALLRMGLPDGDDDTFASFAARLGEWPILLKRVNGELGYRVSEARQSLPDALVRVGLALDKAGLTAFDAKNADDRAEAVAMTLNASLDLLTPSERRCFEELAIFPKDIDVPLTAVETLWGRSAGLDENQTEQFCTHLGSRSLLWSLDLTARWLRLHDVVRDYLLTSQRQSLPRLHGEMVDAYRTKCNDGWHTGPDDGYFFVYLPYHLDEAGRTEELRALLFDYLWLRRKLEVAGVNSAIADLERAEGDVEAAKLTSVLRCSSRVLKGDSRQLARQLLCHLAPDDGTTIATLLLAAEAFANQPSVSRSGAT